ncbi:recombinase family protein [Haematomicrobium sanguinis]|uniref:recombinase family protein n=1 Tax=Haematomicrobium sanguinis TaxID=479106 RepID=UPI0009FE5C05|nr:recombinase family protein [Haematomicrobium sanguinis]
MYLRVSTSRQANENGEAEGYSIPAQREACRRKAEEHGATVIEEFVDAGASARSADRDGLQAMFGYLGQQGADYVIVHKIDRLARDRMDDAFIHLKIKSAGAALVSVMENIDDTPSGKFQHAVMAGMAEYYSSNLSHEAKKGIG